MAAGAQACYCKHDNCGFHSHSREFNIFEAKRSVEFLSSTVDTGSIHWEQSVLSLGSLVPSDGIQHETKKKTKRKLKEF